jgi:hypothetical protein
MPALKREDEKGKRMFAVRVYWRCGGILGILTTSIDMSISFKMNVPTF